MKEDLLRVLIIFLIILGIVSGLCGIIYLSTNYYKTNYQHCLEALSDPGIPESVKTQMVSQSYAGNCR